jgi:outer membrane protein OmpA-like peptidoglycan-associated protein
MKRLILIGAIALAAVGMTVSTEAGAQENGNRDCQGHIVRGPYVTNRFGDNWFIGAGGGINLFINKDNTPAVGPSVDASLGKWFTPSIGMRVGYQGIISRVWSEQPSVFGADMDPEQAMFAQKFGYMYIHGDFLLNFSNAVSGYKQTRFWNFVPYLHAGYYRAYGLKDVDFADNEIAGGAGLLHNLRLTERLDLIIDMRATVVNGRAHAASRPAVIPSVTAGLAVDLGYPGFIRVSSVLDAVELASLEREAALEAAVAAMELANSSLMDENKKMSQANDTLRVENEKLKKRISHQPDYVEFFENIEPAVIFFEIGKTELSEKELAHLDFFAKNLIARADSLTKLNVTLLGSADSNTGSMKRNRHLSQARAEYVCNVLIERYGIDPGRLEVRSEVMKADQSPEMSRAVILSF